MSMTAHEKLSMFVNIKKGDVILTGKFKNSPKTVKSFGTDDKNQPTVNGSPALSFRIKKLMPAKAKESAMLLPIEQRLIRLNARRIASDKTASVFPWFMTTGGALAGGSAGAVLGRQIGENMSDSRTGRRIGTVAGGVLGALGGGYAGYRLAPAFGIEESLGAGPRTGTYGDVMRRGGLLGAMSGAATGGITGGLEGAVTGGLTGIPLGIGIGALSRYAADRSYGSTPGSRRKVVPGEFFGTAPKLSYYGGYSPVMDKRSSTFPLFSTLTGATLGGITGAGIGMHAQSGRFTTPRDRYRNMLIGGVLGAGLGGVGGYYAAPYGRMEEAFVAPGYGGNSRGCDSQRDNDRRNNRRTHKRTSALCR